MEKKKEKERNLNLKMFLHCWKKKKTFIYLGVVVHPYNPSHLRRLRWKDCKPKANQQLRETESQNKKGVQLSGKAPQGLIHSTAKKGKIIH